jgi:hypothetical protein
MLESLDTRSSLAAGCSSWRWRSSFEFLKADVSHIQCSSICNILSSAGPAEAPHGFAKLISRSVLTVKT